MTDELKPVRCGCGGEAFVHLMGFEKVETRYYVQCDECGTRTEIQYTEAEAIEAWNKAMGRYKSKYAITKGYWMATYDGLHCSVCNYKCESTALPNVCPHCGTSMKTVNEWSL